MEAFYTLLGIGIVLAPLILSVVAIVRSADAKARLGALEAGLRQLSLELAEARAELAALGTRPGPAAGEMPAAPPAAEPAPPDEPFEALGEPPPRPPSQRAQAAAAGARGLEEALTSRWLVWLGALAIALGGTFLVKYAIDSGWLGPAVRVSLGFLLGGALALAGEALRRHPPQRAIAAIRPDYVPLALTAAGLFTAFASLYAAYALHDFLGPLLAFAGLAAVALAAVALSILQGPFVALLGLVGAYATPALVSPAEPAPWALFGYLLVITLSCLSLVRWQAWWWLGFAALAGAALWPLAWIVVLWRPEDTLPLGIYLLLTAGGFLVARHGLAAPEGFADWLKAMGGRGMPLTIAWGGAIAVTLLLLLLVDSAGHATDALVFVALFALACLAAGRLDPAFEGLWIAAGLLVLAVMVSWPMPGEVMAAAPLYSFDGRTLGTDPAAALVPPELTGFAVAAAAFGALFGIAGFLALWGARTPAVWAGGSAAVPVLLLVVAYARIVGFRVELGWALLAIGLAAAALAAAARVAARRDAPGMRAALGCYAATVVAFLSLGAAMSLEQAWLTVALSVQLPALGWIRRRLDVRLFQRIAEAVAGVVLVRLVLNWEIVDYPVGDHPLFNWVLYGYGIPAAMFPWAAALFRGTGARRLMVLLEAGALAFGVLLVSLEIRLLTAGSLDSPDYGLLEQSLQSIAWLSLGSLLALVYLRRAHPVALVGARILVGLALAQVVAVQLLVSNPLWTPEPVGDYPVANLLFLAYAVPALFLFRFAAALRAIEPRLPRWLPGGLGALLVFAWISLEVRRAFTGTILVSDRMSDGELYSYSLAWLAYAGALLGLGLLRGEAALRYASLAFLLLAVAKAFVLDMEGLTGLYRVASFLGLGLSLVAIGFVYQRFVFVRRTA